MICSMSKMMVGHVEIKKMETDDEIRGKAYVHWKSWHEAYPGLVSDEYLEKLTLEKCEKMAYSWPDNLIVAKENGRVIGFVGYGDRGDEAPDTGEIFALYVLSEYYGKGVGLRLIKAGLEQLKGYSRICLWVLKDNKRAIRFYQKCGFAADGEELISPNIGAAEIRMVMKRKQIDTERLILRPWEETDAEECYRYAKDPLVGPAAGWPVHTSIDNSRQVIRDVLMVPETYAIVLKETGLPIGSIGLHFHSDLADKEDEAELGYWLGRPYWGRNIVPEAARELLRHAFDDLQLARVWCGYYDGNEKSKRVQEKLGFQYQWTTEDAPVPQMGETRKGHVNLMTREEWLARQ